MSTIGNRIVLLTEGFSDPVTAKTAACVVRYRPDDVVAVLDAENAGKTAQEIFGAGNHIPVVASLGEAMGATTLMIGTAPTGGRLPQRWRRIIGRALENGLNVVSGLHDFLADDTEFSALAASSGAAITDIRRNNESGVSAGQPMGNQNLRVHTVGHDCSIGKMVTSVELTRCLQSAGHDAKFLATGQTGIMISGEGVPIDTVVGDFVAGAAERLVLRNRNHKILVVEGQGSLAHPLYSAVTLGLLHGSQPQGLILCYEATREECGCIPGHKLPSLSVLKRAYETVAQLVHPTQFIGVAMNGRLLSVAQAEEEKQRASDELGLPVCDVFRDGANLLAGAVLELQESLNGENSHP